LRRGLKLSKEELERLDEWLREYNRGTRPKPNFSPEVLREIRRYQAERIATVTIL
jgi:hypothetical protein